MVSQIKLGDVAVDVVLKDIKNVHLSVHPPTGRVRISAPSRMSLDTIRVFAISKLAWIRQQQQKLREQERETPREYLDRESHYVWGRRYLLEVVLSEEPSGVLLKHRRLILTVRPGTKRAARDALLAQWYREQVKALALDLVAKWEPVLSVQVRSVFVQQMKTRWGSCNANARTIRLNTELAKKPQNCLNYIVLHEMLHFLEPRHGERFVALMDRFMPRWQFVRQKLNQLPVRHEGWDY
jgi:predicted metal-dependent hydrolase